MAPYSCAVLDITVKIVVPISGSLLRKMGPRSRSVDVTVDVAVGVSMFVYVGQEVRASLPEVTPNSIGRKSAYHAQPTHQRRASDMKTA